MEFLFVVEEKSDDVEAEEIDDNENRFEGGRRDEELLLQNENVESVEGLEV